MTVRDAPGKVAQVGVLALLAVAEFMLTLDLSIVNVALPSIRNGRATILPRFVAEIRRVE